MLLDMLVSKMVFVEVSDEDVTSIELLVIDGVVDVIGIVVVVWEILEAE